MAEKNLAPVERIERAMPVSNQSLYTRIREILESARSRVARSVNTTQVVANWLIGREIVEEEQKGKKRAGYGKRLIESLSAEVTREYGPGYSEQNLFYMKQFYVVYPELIPKQRILHAPRGQSLVRSESNKLHAPSEESEYGMSSSRRDDSWRPGLLHPNFSWTHYRTLLRVDPQEARSFYEIESHKNNRRKLPAPFRQPLLYRFFCAIFSFRRNRRSQRPIIIEEERKPNHVTDKRFPESITGSVLIGRRPGRARRTWIPERKRDDQDSSQ